MTDYAVELRNVTKVFASGRGAKTDEVYAVKEMNLGIPPGQFFTLLGPSGCGKTTTLRLIAGFETPSSGEIYIQGKPVSRIPPNERPVNTVFQNYALFPHMNVARNVAFGLAIKRVPRDEQERLVTEALELVQLADMGRRMPSQLSGGQQQRVALARALVNQPAVLLLDEPLGALDLKLRKAMQIELKHIQEQVGITFVYVTHDQEEALTMSDYIAVMNFGLVLQLGDPTTLYKKPANKFVADFIGESNFIQGKVESITKEGIRLRVLDEVITAPVADINMTMGQNAIFTIRPEKMMLKTRQPASTETLSGSVQDVVYIGTDTRYIVYLRSGESVVVRVQNGSSPDVEQFSRGDQVKVVWLPEDARILAG